MHGDPDFGARPVTPERHRAALSLPNDSIGLPAFMKRKGEAGSPGQVLFGTSPALATLPFTF